MEELQLYIDQYINGELEGEELEKFEKKLSIDTEFKKEVEFYRATQTALINKEKIQAFGELIPQLNTPIVNEKEAKIKTDWQRSFLKSPWMKVAAVILVLVVSIPIFLLLRPDPAVQHYAGYFSPYSSETAPIDDPLVSGSIENLSPQELWNTSIQSFEQESWQEAKHGFQLLVERAYQTEKAQIYLANCYLAELKPDSAITLLYPLAQPNIYPTDISEPAAWYLGLAYWKKGQFEEALKSLKTLKDSKTYGRQADEFIHKMLQ